MAIIGDRHLDGSKVTKYFVWRRELPDAILILNNLSNKRSGRLQLIFSFDLAFSLVRSKRIQCRQKNLKIEQKWKN